MGVLTAAAGCRAAIDWHPELGLVGCGEPVTHTVVTGGGRYGLCAAHAAVCPRCRHPVVTGGMDRRCGACGLVYRIAAGAP